MKVAVIGCTHAGVFSAQTILTEHPDWEVTVYERNDNLSFLSCGIALWVGDHVSDPKKMFYSSPEALASLGAHMKMEHDVLSVDVAAKSLVVKDLKTGEESTDTFDKLVVTTGSAPVIPPIDGIDNKNVMLCKNFAHAKALKDIAPHIKSAVVIGSGYIGAEIAEQFALTGKEVTLVDALPRVLAVGFRPNTALFKGQLDMIGNGAIITNEYMQTSNPDVFAAGDSSVVQYNPTGKDDYIPLATNAVRQGILVGKNIEKPTVKYLGTQATSAVALFDKTLAASGLTVEGAKARGLEVESVTLEQDYRPEFMLSTEPILMQLTWDKATREVKGGAFYSTYDCAQSANVISLAIQKHMTIDELSMVDMFFQPNYDQPVNFVNALAMEAAAKA